MSYNVKVTKKWDYLDVHVTGEWVPGTETEKAIEVLRPITEGCIEHGVFAVLCRIDIDGELPLMSSYDLVDSKEAFKWDDRIKMAMIFKHKKLKEHNKDTANIAMNRGITTKVFDNEIEAKKWLFL